MKIKITEGQFKRLKQNLVENNSNLFTNAREHFEFRGGNGAMQRPDSWKPLSGNYSLNNGFFGWVDNEGRLFSIKIPQDVTFKDRVLNYLNSNFKRNDSVPVLGY